MPALIDDGHVLAQSLAIIEYLDEAYPEPPFLPKDLFERAYVRRLSQIIGCDIHPLNNVRVLKWLAANVPDDKGLADRWYAHWIAEGFRAFEACLVREARHGTYCLGDRLTMADICLVPQVANARRFNCDLSARFRCRSPSPTASRSCLPVVQRVAPDTQPDKF